MKTIRLMIRLFLAPTILALSIFVMAGVYQHMWSHRPDYFRVQSGVNFMPLDVIKIADLSQIARAYSADSENKKVSDLLRQLGEGEEAAAARIKDTYHNYQSTAAVLAAKQSEYTTRLQRDVDEYKAFEGSQWAQFGAFVDQRTVMFRDQIKTINDKMQNILADSRVKSVNDLSKPRAIEYAQLAAKLVLVTLQMTAAEVSARAYGISHLTTFQQEPDQQEYLARHQELESLSKEISELQTSMLPLHEDLYAAFTNYITSNVAHLGYWDFLYFSVGAATTATFGDISPNATPIRNLVCLQVLGSVIFTGWMINKLAGGRIKP